MIISFLIKALLFVIGGFLVLLVLVQRGRGGGLAGALGGMGGQSAFGTKAGDVFTRVTVVVAAIWILLCAAAVKYYKPSADSNPFAGVSGPTQAEAPSQPEAATPSGTATPTEEKNAAKTAEAAPPTVPSATPAASTPAKPAAAAPAPSASATPTPAATGTGS